MNLSRLKELAEADMQAEAKANKKSEPSMSKEASLKLLKDLFSKSKFDTKEQDSSDDE